MALSSKKLYYRYNGNTYSCNLYTSPTDDGMADSAKLYYSGNLYCPLVSVGDSRQSHIRVLKSGTTYSIAKYIINYISTWTQFGFVDNPTVTSQNPNRQAFTDYSVDVDYNHLFSTGTLYNIRIQFNVQAQDETYFTPWYFIDNVQYYIQEIGPGMSGTYYAYHRLSTGTHTIRLYGFGNYNSEYGTIWFETYGHRVVPT